MNKLNRGLLNTESFENPTPTTPHSPHNSDIYFIHFEFTVLDFFFNSKFGVSPPQQEQQYKCVNKLIAFVRV